VPFDDVDAAYEPDSSEFEIYETIKKMIIIVSEDLREPIKLHLFYETPLKKIANDYRLVYSRLRYWNNKFIEALRPFFK
jgi:hypothetical protein